MKKTLTTIALLVAAVSGYSQGIVSFYDTGSGFAQSIWNVQTAAPGGTGATLTTVTYGGYTINNEYTGTSSVGQETPTGAVVWKAGTALTGTGYDWQALAAVDSVTGLASPLSSLAPVGTVGTFYTTPTSALGLGKGSQTLSFSTGTTITIAIAAWNNGGGAYQTLAAAQAAGEPWGISNLADEVLATGTATPTLMNPTIEGFSLGTVPEPSTIALGVMGASALLFRRRK